MLAGALTEHPTRAHRFDGPFPHRILGDQQGDFCDLVGIAGKERQEQQPLHSGTNRCP